MNGKEILEMAWDAAEKARSMGEVITENSKKWRERENSREKNNCSENKK